MIKKCTVRSRPVVGALVSVLARAEALGIRTLDRLPHFLRQEILPALPLHVPA
jgi:hypothetical protein